jgi:uncharacterized protein YbjT (DUF2867 family)
MNILITGATGMVGSFALKSLLESSGVDSVLSIGRRKTGVEDSKLKEIVLEDFMTIGDLKDQLEGFDACIHCLGVYQSQVSKEDFFKITSDYQKALTDVLEETSPNLIFCLFGAQGADTSGKSNVTFAKAKGQAENQLMETKFPKKYIFRPGYIKPTGNSQPAGLVYKISIPIANVAYRFFPNIGIEDANLAKAMVQLAMKPDLESQVFENVEIKQLV